MNPSSSILFIHPPVVKPCEPPAGIARIIGALRPYGIDCHAIDANLEGLYHILGHVKPPTDTWSKRAYHNIKHHIQGLAGPGLYQNMDQYRRAVADIGRILSLIGATSEVRLGLADYRDARLLPVRSADLLTAAKEPARNPYYGYYQDRLLPQIEHLRPDFIGISINYLSQALCAFALIGLLKKSYPAIKIILGGGLITSWLKGTDSLSVLIKSLSDMVDQVVCGPGESFLLDAFGKALETKFFLPDYSDFLNSKYLSPGFILPFSASDGCWWRRCAFCPERAEKRIFKPLPNTIATQQLSHLANNTSPVMMHLLDNALSPALLKKIAAMPRIAPWYGFVRIGAPLDSLEFCHQLAASGCVMLKIGLESGSQKILNQMEKGINLAMAAKVLENLSKARIATYVYLLFGTPSESRSNAMETLNFVSEHSQSINFLNLAVFNLPIKSPDAAGLELHDFYDGDLALYRDFVHPKEWNRTAVRRFLSKTFKKHPDIQSILRHDPPIFTSNHAPFFHLTNKML